MKKKKKMRRRRRITPKEVNHDCMLRFLCYSFDIDPRSARSLGKPLLSPSPPFCKLSSLLMPGQMPLVSSSTTSNEVADLY